MQRTDGKNFEAALRDRSLPYAEPAKTERGFVLVTELERQMYEALVEAERCLGILAAVNMQRRNDAEKLSDLASSRLDGIRVLKIARAALKRARGEE